jgi:hypothetical protein
MRTVRNGTMQGMADLNQMAYRVVQHATEPQEEPSKARINGLKGGKARAKKLSSEERSEIARRAAAARWRKAPPTS